MHPNGRETAQLLWHHWQAGTTIDSLPAALRPAGRAEGYAAQAWLPEVSGRLVEGWKIAATSTGGQRHIGVDGPLAGRVLTGQVYRSGASLSLSGNRMRVVEPEFAFRFARDLPPRRTPYEAANVLDAVEAVFPALELPDSRFADFVHAGEAQLLADNACTRHFVLGKAELAAWRDIDLRAHSVSGVVRRSQGDSFTRVGDGSAVLGDPRSALAWLVNELSALGLTLQAGQFVSTGTCMPPLEVLPGDVVEADFGELGSVRVQVTE